LCAYDTTVACKHTRFVLVIAWLSTGCSGPPVPTPTTPQATRSAPYRVQVGDQLAIRLFLTPELNEDVTVRPDGRITTQIAEAIPAAGYTPEQVALSLRSAYAAELKEPRITVEVKAASPMRVYVAGEVVAAGEFTTQGPPMTLLQAVARAGGLRVTGDANRVLIVRRGADNRPSVLITHYAEALAGKDPAADLDLQPFDVVIVPRTSIAEVYIWVNQHIQQFVPVSWGFSYNVSPLVNSAKP
jgi:polysaccharide export outer membrane protein